MRVLATLLVTLSLAACSPLDAIKAVAPAVTGGGPSVSAQVGEEANKQVVVGDQRKHEQELEIVGDHSAVEVTTDNRKVGTNVDGDIKADDVSFTNYPSHFIYVLLAIAIAGWIAPTPRRIWRGLRNWRDGPK